MSSNLEKPNSIKELCEFIWYLEDKYNLLDSEIYNVKIWHCERMRIYYWLAQKMDLLLQPHSRLPKVEELKLLFGNIKNSFRDNLFTLKKSDIVFLSHPRTTKVNSDHIDIYTKYFIDEIKNKLIILELERPYLGAHKKRRQNFTHYTDWVALTQKTLRLFTRVKLQKSESSVIKEVQDEICTVCGVNIDLLKYVKGKIKNFKVLYKIYCLIFSKVAPKTLYIITSYFNAPIIKAAKDHGVEVIELQHGTFSKYHLGYSFPDRQTPLEYFPDKFYVWNAFWKEMIKLPLKNEDVVIDRFRHLEYEKSQYASYQQDDKKLVVISQGAIGNSIAEYILQHFNMFKNKKIFYKLHPGEFDRWESYPALNKLSKNDNVKIIKNEMPLYKLFAMCKTQVGVFSTAIYEGIEFGCKTILLNVQGIEYMEKLIKSRPDDVELI